MRSIMLGLAFASGPLTGLALAQEPGGNASAVFDLGQITVMGRRPEAVVIGSDTLSGEAIYRFNRPTLDQAVGLMPGVASSNSGGSRNERLISVRGFDRFQVPLSIDGIRVYLPADNRLDFARFLTPDIAEVQVAKGYASVIDGPGAMGGTINLVTRTPTKDLDAEAVASLNADSDIGYGSGNLFGLLGTRKGGWYAQASGAWRERDHFSLSSDFAPTAIEDGGARANSQTEDWRINLKLGLTPREGDEYSLNFTRQEGSKNAPYHVSDPINLQRFWSWPYWNLDSLYFLSNTALTDSSTLKLRLYRNTFDNLLRAFDDAAQSRQTLGRAFDSFYEDEAYGGSAELRLFSGSSAEVRLAAHYRRDEHVEYQTSFTGGGFTEPRQTSVEDTYSLAAEGLFALSEALTLTAGASYDWRDLKQAEDFAANAFVLYPLEDSDAWNAQGLLAYALPQNRELHASLSSRTRFPTLFERFSSRFGGATSNAGLKAERATNAELGGSGSFGRLFVEGALFYSDITDLIVAVPIVFNGQPVSQSQNVGSAEFAGAEIALNAALSDALLWGANYTYTHRTIDNPVDPAIELTGVPEHKAFAFVEWSPLAWLHITPSLDYASDRWTVNTAGTSYYKTGGFVLADLRIETDLSNKASLAIGTRNTFDENYLLTDGFPEEGRSFFASLRLRH